MRIDNFTLNYSGSSDTGLRRNISKVSVHGYNGGLVIADGKVFTFNGSEGNTNYTRGCYASSGTEGSGLLNTREIVFPGESGSLVDADQRSTQGWALFDNGNLWMWGYNGRGALGDSTTTDRYLPVRTATNVAKMFTHPSQEARQDAYVHYFHQKTDGKVYGTGYNGFGQLGLGNTTDVNTWTEITGAGTNPQGVWPLGNYTGATVVQKSDGSIWTCGYGSYGQLGLGNTTQSTTTLTNTGTGWNGGDTSMRIQTVAFGGGTSDGTQYEQCTIAMFMDNGSASRIATCGNNNWGQLGDTTTIQRTTPIVPTGISGRISKMMWSGCSIGQCWILKTDGTLWNWGYNTYGQCGRGDTATPKSTPAQVTTNVLDLFIHNHTWFNWGYENGSPIVYKADGYYRCGYNGYAALGIGNTTSPISTLTKMRFPEGIVFKMFGAMGAQTNSQQTFIGVDTLNQIWAWGSNGAYGITSVGSGGTMPQPIQINPSALQR